MNRGDKIYLDKNETKESAVNDFLACRDGIVELYEYVDDSGYGSDTRLFLCKNTKHESVALIRQFYARMSKEWSEKVMYFDLDSFKFLEALINGKKDQSGGKYTLVRNYCSE
jgi:hypothetical protein